ncbi:hypothetical protein TRFO_06657 [Tritrichomonas foetus]|uniref:Uncharacterized protein n=1 Tax=Tritrichomonas foetus TaxID=1144522 RepID=A0A1J4K107_9EUKA|nr:hypothetical protein TRFO_06657 [Tritrichomonas foetus]|eukprot:OHT03428.1 hypothetical protein TRFO_06657 [Tritrichomonas foetus]
MSLSELLSNFHNLSVTNLSQNYDQADEMLVEILGKLRGEIPDSEILYKVPGSHFSFANSEATIQNMTQLFDDLYLKNEEYSLSRIDLIANIALQIISFDFPHFSKYVIDNKNRMPDRIKYKIYQVIVDSTSGFLLNAPMSPRNRFPGSSTSQNSTEINNNNEDINMNGTKFQFFNLDSPDLKTPFGLALTSFRQEICKILINEINQMPNEIYSDDRPTVNVPSILPTLLSTIIPPYFHDSDIGCGFPGRPEVLFAITKLQNQTCYVKRPKRHHENSEVMSSWIKFYIDVSGFESSKYDEELVFAEPQTIEFSPIVALMKMFPDVAPSIALTNEMDLLAKHVVSGILGPDPMYASFLIVWTQVMLYLIPDFSFELFDHFFHSMNLYHTFSMNQKHTFILAITRFISILCCHFERYLNQKQTISIHSFAMLNLCSISPDIRYEALKLLRVLYRFANDMESPMKSILHFFNEGEPLILSNYLRVFRDHPSVSMQSNLLMPSVEPTFMDLLLCKCNSLWLIAILTLAPLAADYLDNQSLDDFKRFGFNYIKKLINFPDDKNAKISMILIFTLLGSCADIPIGLADEEYSQQQIELSESIIYEGIQISKYFTHDLYHKLHIMFRSVNVSAFPYLISLCKDINNVNILVLILYAFVMNSNFDVMMQHNDFHTAFLSIFTIVTNKLFEMNILQKNTFFQSTPSQNKTISENAVIICDYLMVVLSIFKNYEMKYQEEIHGLIPILPFVFNTELPVLKNMSFLFSPLFNLTFFTPNTPIEKRLHIFAINAFSELVACISIPDDSLFLNLQFIEQIHFVSLELPSIMTNLMVHHFSTLFPRFLDSAMSPGGKQYFNAISSLFALHPAEVEMRPKEYFINTLWPSCASVETNPIISEYLQVIYENCGTFILCCLFYLVEPEKELSYRAFLLIVVLSPILSLYHFNGRSDYVKPLFTAFLRLANLYGQSISNLQVATVTELSEILSQHFSFCLEQFLEDALDLIPQFNQETIHNSLFVITPWFKQVIFDMENRVISKETELIFMRFSCYSFIDKLLSAIPQVDLLDVNSASLNIWRALVMDGDIPKINIVPILIALMNAAENSSNHAVLYPLFRYLYRLQSNTVSDCLTSYLSFSYNFFSSQMYPSVESNFRLSDYIGGYDQEIDDSSSATASKATNVIMFVITELHTLASDTVVPLIPYLPIIFAFSLANIDLYFDKINLLTSTIFTQLKPLIEDDVLSIYNEAYKNVKFLLKTEDLSKINKTKILRGNVPLPGTNLTRISGSFSNLFLSYDEALLKQYEMQLLQWALCCGDLMRATNALFCLQGSITLFDNEVIGLFSRALFSVAECAAFLYNERHADITIYAYYMRALLLTLKPIALYHANKNTLFTVSSIMWIAIESLKCNTPDLSSVFEAALELFNVFLYHPELFSLISYKKEYTGGQFTPGVFWKYHEPWDDKFHGCSRNILEFTPREHNNSHCLNLVITTLNLMIQTNFSTLFSDSPLWYYTALLSLLPWMWTVILTDFNQFMFDTENVKLLADTHESLMQFLEDPELVESMSIIVGNGVFDLYEHMIKITKRTILCMNKEDLPSIAIFFTNYVKFGQSFAKIPLYSIVTQILELAPEYSIHFADFIVYADADLNSSRRIYIELLFDKFKRIKATERIERTFSFPYLILYDRIVAILIPQMYEFDTTEQILTNFDELRSFPPLLPREPNLYYNTKFNEIAKSLRTSKIEPFNSWNEILTKMHTSLIDNDLLQEKKIHKVKSLKADLILKQVLEEIREDNKDVLPPTDYTQEMENEECHEYQEQLPDNPYELIILKAEMFLPTVEDANYVGDELFEQIC